VGNCWHGNAMTTTTTTLKHKMAAGEGKRNGQDVVSN